MEHIKSMAIVLLARMIKPLIHSGIKSKYDNVKKNQPKQNQTKQNSGHNLPSFTPRNKGVKIVSSKPQGSVHLLASVIQTQITDLKLGKENFKRCL